MRTKKNKIYKRRSRKQSGGNPNIIVVRKANNMENEILYPILKNIYKNKTIKFVDFLSEDKIKDENIYNLKIKSNWEEQYSKSKYIFISGESFDKTYSYSFNDEKCICNFLTTQDERVKNIKNYFYLPMFLNVGPILLEKSPFIREFVNNERPRLAAYIALNHVEHRSNFFKILSDLDDTKTVDGLGQANHTRDVELPDRSKWWEISKIYKDYKFGFAMENHYEDGYITEKIINVYRGGAIPIYWGTSKVKEIFNHEAFIYINDFANFEEAAKYIIELSKDNERLNKMFNAPLFKEDSIIDYSKYYDAKSPQWVLDIANSIKDLIKKGENKNKLLVELKGGLGNRLFQILAGYGFANKWNMNIEVYDYGGNHVNEETSKTQIRELFPELKYVNNYDKSKFKEISEKEEFIYNDIENPNENVLLKGYFQSEKYFPSVLPLIYIKGPTNNLLENIDTNKLFFIHFRLGDYIGNKNVNLFSDNSIVKYYKYCINKIKEQINNPLFLIVTDDIDKTNEFIKNNLLNDLSNNYIIDTSTSRIDSLYYMSQCKGGIIVNSTFSWFGGFFIKNKNKDLLFIIKPWFSRFDPSKKYDIYPSWATIVDINLLKGGGKSIAYVINLDDRKDRWEKTQELFKNSSIELERISAIRNKNGHLGCGMSIQKVIQMAKDNNMETVLILEDDNKPLENFDIRWQTVKKWCDENMDKWDILNGSAKLGEGNNEKNVRLKYKLENNVNLFEGDYILNTNWIYINKSVYDKILNWNPTIVWAIDRYVGDIKYMRNLFVFPFLSLQDNGMSNTDSVSKNYNSENNNRIKVLEKALNQQKGGKRRKTKKLKKQKGGSSKYTAIIVEPRKHKALGFVLKNILENLNNDWNIVIFHGNLNKEYVENIVNTSLEHYKNRITLKSLNKDNLSLGDYNALLTSKDFYNNVPTEMFLVFQTDSMINPKNKDKIYEFMKYDYVGAPWLGENNYMKGNVGNGGFSLRRKSKMLEIIEKVPYNTFAEDVYFALPPSSIQINKPTMEQAQKFSSEEAWDKESFGVHKVWVHVDNSILLNDFPEIKPLIDLQGIDHEGGNEPIDIVITFHIKDIKVLPYTLKGLENINKRNIYLISNEDPKIENAIYIDEKIFPFKKDDLIQFIGEENGHRAGWYYQQLLKLYAFKVIPNLSENFLIVDSETVFLNTVSFIDDNKLLYATGTENHAPYFEHINCLFNGTLRKQYPDKSGIVHHMIFSKKYLQEMFDKIEEIKNDDTWKAFMKCVNKESAGLSGMTEYETFFNYMLQYHKDKAKIRDLRWANLQDVPNYSDYNTIDELLLECKKNYDFITLHEMYLRGTKMNIEKTGGNNEYATVVSAYYPIKSKRSIDEYKSRIQKFWSIIPCNLVFFTSEGYKPFIEEVRKDFRDKTKIVTIEIEDFEALKKYPRSFWEEQYEKDSEKYHSPELYMVWFEKKEFVLKAIKMNPFNTEKFVWCDAGIGSSDAGIYDKNTFQYFPIASKIPNDKFLILKFRDISKNNINTNLKNSSDTTGGGILAASNNIWKKFSKMYDNMMAYYIKTNRFVGKEQNIFTSIIIKEPNFFETIQPNNRLYYTLLYYLSEN